MPVIPPITPAGRNISNRPFCPLQILSLCKHPAKVAGAKCWASVLVTFAATIELQGQGVAEKQSCSLGKGINCTGCYGCQSHKKNSNKPVILYQEKAQKRK
jgi:hypothetical protein